jgi:hypothetical protein
MRGQFEQFLDALPSDRLAQLGFPTGPANIVLARPVPVLDDLRNDFAPLAQAVRSVYPDMLSEECIFANALWAVLQLRSDCHAPSSSDVDAAFEAMIEGIEYEINDYTAVVPIENLKLDIPELGIADVKIVPPTDSRLDVCRSLLLEAHLREHQPDFEYVHSFAIVTVRAQSEKAKAIAIDKVKDVLNVLRLFVGGIRVQDMQILREVRLIGETGVSHGRYVYLTHQYVDDSGGGTGTGANGYIVPRSPGLATVCIGEEFLATLEKNGLPYIETVLQSKQTGDNDRDKLKTKTYRAITWFGKGICADADDEKFISYMIALETLLIDKEQKKRQTLADRVSCLLNTDPAERRKLSKCTKELYDVRSGIVHGGAKTERVGELEVLTRAVIRKVVRMNLATFDEFLRWIQMNC